jgi:SynChlorMet cassette protein ScmC
MQLRTVQGRGRGRVCVVSGWKGGYGGRAVVCRLGPGRGRLTEVFRMEQVATAIAVRSLARGGLMLHGALAVRDGVGFILAGPSGAGKSTASQRLPAPWKSLSDDCALVVRDATGLYWAHPWATWSLLRDNGQVASWPVEQAVPLKALLFLIQSPFDRVEPVAITPATALIMESAVQLARTIVFTPDGAANRAICAKYLRAAWGLAAAVPAFRLRISLTGEFWNEIERAVESEPRMDRCGHQIEQNPESRNQNAELPRKGPGNRGIEGSNEGLRTGQKAEIREQNAELRQNEATRARRRRSVPEPPFRLLSGSPKPKLVRFQTGHRTFLKLVKGRRVVASVNDVMREWHVRRPSRVSANNRTVRKVGSRATRKGMRN